MNFFKKMFCKVENPIINNPESSPAYPHAKERFYWKTVKCPKCGAFVNIYAYKNYPTYEIKGKCPLCGAVANESSESVEVMPKTHNEAKETGQLVLFCQGGCGKTSNDVGPFEFWRGEIKDSADPSSLVPDWTCRECKEKKEAKKNGKSI